MRGREPRIGGGGYQSERLEVVGPGPYPVLRPITAEPLPIPSGTSDRDRFEHDAHVLGAGVAADVHDPHDLAVVGAVVAGEEDRLVRTVLEDLGQPERE